MHNAAGFGLDAAIGYARLRRHDTGRQAVVVRSTEAVLVPTAAVGFVALWSWNDAQGSPVAAILRFVMVPVGIAAVFAPFAYCLASASEDLAQWRPSARAKMRAAAAVFSLLTTLVATGCASWSIENRARKERGIEVTCTVIAITQESRPTGDGTGSETYYLHRIACPPGGPSSVTSGTREAEPGHRLRVVYDPENRLHPTTETSPVDWHLTATIAAIALAASLALNITRVAARARD